MSPDPEKEPEPKPAAVLILVRPKENGFQVYLLRRSGASRFLPGAHVFPGGKVDPEDCGLEPCANRLNIHPEDMGENLGDHTLSPEEALPFVIAAIRETFEEAGVLLGSRNRNTAPDLADLLDRRRKGSLTPGWFKTDMIEESWVLEASRLFRWSHWITPRLMKHRYNTRFFLAPMPENQTCTPDQREASDGLWMTPQEALTANLAGDISLSPPALVTLHELQTYRSLEHLMKAASVRSWGSAIEPRLIPMSRGAVVLEPWDPMYEDDSVRIENHALDAYLLGPEEPFSRIWNNGRHWRPIRFQDRY
jgi:8-oxo-dGTP pyrophosphatase MutT (NUDIX family)